MAAAEENDADLERRRSRDRRRWARALFAVVLVLVIASVAVLDRLGPPPTRTVIAPPSEVILAVADIPDIGWGLRASGANGTGVWRLFSVHNELILAFLNVTLWVESGADRAQERYAEIAGAAGYPVEDGGVVSADASLFWSYDDARYAGMVVRRYNVVFLLSAYLESSFALTRSDLGSWAGWQLGKIETFAA